MGNRVKTDYVIDTSAQKAAELAAMSKRMRLAALDMALASGKNGSHLGGSLSCIEILAVLYGEVLRYDTEEPLNEQRAAAIPFLIDSPAYWEENRRPSPTPPSGD